MILKDLLTHASQRLEAAQLAYGHGTGNAQDEAALDALDGEVSQARKSMLAECGRQLDELHDAQAAVQQVRALMFVARFAQDIERRRDQLGQ